MITLLTGFPGSGKTYYAVEKIYSLLTDPNPSEIDIIYSNINGLDFNAFPNSAIDFQKLDLDDLYNYLTMLYNIYKVAKNSDNVDDELIKFAKERGYYRAYFVFDECHDFFSKDDPIKIFWLTYHRHIFQEILLLTQNKTLINSKYRAVPEIFIEAQPRSKKLFSKQLTYKKFSSFAMRKSDFFEKSSLTTQKEVFQLYASGNMSNQKSILSRYLKFILGGFVFMIFLFYYLFSNLTKTPPPPPVHNPPFTKIPSDISTRPDIVPPLEIEENKSTIKREIVSLPPALEVVTPQGIFKNVNDKKISFTVICDSDLGCNYNNKNYTYEDFISVLEVSKASYKSISILDTQTHKIDSLSVTVSQSNLNEHLGEI